MHKSEHYKQEPAEAYTALRAPFDPWFAAQAAAAGVLVITKTTVTDVLQDEKGRVIGVRTDRPDGEVYAPDRDHRRRRQQPADPEAGPGSRRSAAALRGLVGQGSTSACQPKDIEARFGLAGPNEGVAIDIFGDATLGLPGTAFIYTDKQAISIGVGLLLEEFVYHNLRPYEVLARFKNHPVIKPYLRGRQAAGIRRTSDPRAQATTACPSCWPTASWSAAMRPAWSMPCIAREPTWR